MDEANKFMPTPESDRTIQSSNSFICAPAQPNGIDGGGPRVILALLIDEDATSFMAMPPENARMMAHEILRAADRAEAGEGMPAPVDQTGREKLQ